MTNSWENKLETWTTNVKHKQVNNQHLECKEYCYETRKLVTLSDNFPQLYSNIRTTQKIKLILEHFIMVILTNTLTVPNTSTSFRNHCWRFSKFILHTLSVQLQQRSTIAEHYTPIYVYQQVRKNINMYTFIVHLYCSWYSNTYNCTFIQKLQVILIQIRLQFIQIPQVLLV